MDSREYSGQLKSLQHSFYFSFSSYCFPNNWSLIFFPLRNKGVQHYQPDPKDKWQFLSLNNDLS
jgi:hypothetical protein